MKRTLSFLLALLFLVSIPTTVYAAGVWQNPASPNDNNIYFSGGNVGIGVTAPETDLRIDGNLKLTNGYVRTERNSNYAAFQSFQLGSGEVFRAGYSNSGVDYSRMAIRSNGAVIISDNTDSISSSSYGLNIDNDDKSVQLSVNRANAAAGSAYSIAEFKYQGANRFRVVRDGAIVDGRLQAGEVIVRQNPGTWADYVFADGYKLKSLASVESFVNENKHLPGIPSASEVEASGLDMGEMQRLQMEKIEELFLYTISQQQEIAALKEALNAK